MSIDFIIDLIYRAALDDNWQAVLAALSVAAGDIHVHLYVHDAAINKVNVTAQQAYDPSFLPAYASHYHGINPWVPGIMKSPVGQALHCENYCSKGDLVRTEFYNDWIRPQEEIAAGGGIVLLKEASRFAILGGNIRYKDEDKKVDPWLDLLNRVGSHLRNAFDLQRTLQGRLLANRTYLKVIDRMANAVVLLDAKGRVQFGNKAADNVLTDQKICFLDRRGALHFHDPHCDNRFHGGLKAIAEKKIDGLSSHFALRHTSGKRVMPATLSPFTPDAGQIGIFADFADARLPIAMLTIGNVDERKTAVDEVLSMTFRLTASEAELAKALWDGVTLQDFAKRRLRSIHTVRQQLRSVFEKTGLNRQSELVSLLSTLKSV